MIPGPLLLFYSPFSSKKLPLNAEKECGRNERKETVRNKKYNTNKEKNCN
jgi:hypothetical protein